MHEIALSGSGPNARKTRKSDGISCKFRALTNSSTLPAIPSRAHLTTGNVGRLNVLRRAPLCGSVWLRVGTHDF